MTWAPDFLDVVTATYAPARRDDLVDGAAAVIGIRGHWQASWIIEGGDYAGQWAMAWRGETALPFAWVPLCDLADVDPNAP